jgi:alkyl sulfatase BDS1-like metallo-beta-lactamase superfamily hydrolase
MERKILRLFIAAGFLGLIIGSASTALSKDTQALPKDAEPATAQANAKVWQELPFWNTGDFDDAGRGFIATFPEVIIYADDGHVAWSLKEYQFLYADKVPPTVNPSLWRQAVLNMNNGLYQVTDNIYQVRGFDLASMMIIEGDTGIILIDPMSSVETARAALQLYRQHRDPEGKRLVKAVIYTHTHADHYGGVRGVVSQEEVDNKQAMIIAPEGFLEHAVSENVFAGTAMGRRALYQYGELLPKGARGQVDSGLGKEHSSGKSTLIAPTHDITPDRQNPPPIDGVEIQFMLAPETEAPAEMLIWFPKFRALCAAEDMNHLNHNLYTLRGAQVRDARKWWKVLNRVLDRFGAEAEVMFFAHTWPVWRDGSKNKIVNFIKKQRDLYKYVHDQSLHLINQGNTMLEVAEKLKLPPSLAQEWFNRDYYGTVNHNAKAVYQKYLGWYDGNPANLHALPPQDAAKRYLEYMGSSQAVIARARQAFKAGDYRWVAQIMNHVVFAEPENRAAKELEADALEQLGYQAESGIWRNHYLTGAFELRNGVPSTIPRTSSTDVLKAMTLDLYFDYLGILLKGPEASGKTLVLNWNLTKPAEQWVLSLENSALTYTGPGKQSSSADATLNMTRATLDRINTGELTWQAAISSGEVQIDGNPSTLFGLFSLMEGFKLLFNIVTP